MTFTENLLFAERRQRRLRELRRCLAVAVNAESAAVAAALIDDALRLRTIEGSGLITPRPLRQETVNAAASS